MSSKVTQTQAVKQSQDQSLKPHMIQSLKMLTLPLMELETMITQELIDNPLLDLTESEDSDEKDNKKEESEEKKDENTDIDDELKKTMEESKELSEILDTWNEYHSEHGTRTESSSDDDEPRFENYIQSNESLKLDFINKFDKYNLKENEYNFIYDLIDNANAYGMLPDGFDIYKLAEEYNIKPQRADELHHLIMTTNPCGITARNISECLYHQLEDYEQVSIIADIILYDFNDLLHRRYMQIAQKYEMTEEEVLDCRNRIGRLDPKPGLRINSGKPQYIVPDVLLFKVDDKFEIIINDFNIPKIALSRRYQSILSEMSHDKEAINYVRNKINSAKFLIKTIFMRNRTLERVFRSIIDHQKKFFYENSGMLVPLTYSVIANDLAVNESTISRVVKNKYADTPFGVFCLKDFFCSNAGKDRNYESVSKQSVQQQIKTMVDNEDSSAPISDQNIVDILLERGINVSRRVITKYREEMMIPNSRMRRK